MDISLVKTLLSEAHRLIIKYKRFLGIYIFLGFLTQGVAYLAVTKVISLSYVFLALFILLEKIAIVYSLPYFLLVREEGKSLSYKKRLLYLTRAMLRLFIPLLALFLLFACGLLFITRGNMEYITGMYSRTHLGLGFYPGDALFYGFIGLLMSQTLFSPIFFSLKNQSLIKSVISSIKLFWRDLPSILPLGLLITAINFAYHLFIGKGSPIIFLLTPAIEYFSLLIGVTAVLYYQKKYSLPSFAEIEKVKPVRKRNVFLRRVGAFFIDKMLVFLYVVYISTILFDSISGSTNFPHIIHLDIGLWIILIVPALYPILSEWLAGGTLGKLACGIRVRHVNGNRITFFQSLLRNIFRIVDNFPFVFPYLVGLITIAASEKKQRVGDMVAKTVVVQKEDGDTFSRLRFTWLFSFFILALVIPYILHLTFGITSPPPNKPSPFALSLPYISPAPLAIVDYAHPVIKNITIRTSIDLTKNYQNQPFKLITNGGHYLFQESGFTAGASFTLSYDGTRVYSGRDLNVYNSVTALSPSGSHFGYIIENKEGNEDIYIDRKKALTTGGPVNKLVVADSGDFYYTISTYSSLSKESENKLHVYKNGKEIFSTYRRGFGETLTISPDGKHYLLWSRSYNDSDSKSTDTFIIDGKETIVDNQLRDVFLSKNWQHYVMICGDGRENSISTLSIDGKIEKEITGVLPFGEILDNGTYSYYLQGPFVDGESNPFPVIEGKTFPYSIRKVLMTDDGKHVLTMDKDNKWEFDETPLTISTPSKYDQVQLVGNTIYVYHLIH